MIHQNSQLSISDHTKGIVKYLNKRANRIFVFIVQIFVTF